MSDKISKKPFITDNISYILPLPLKPAEIDACKIPSVRVSNNLFYKKQTFTWNNASVYLLSNDHKVEKWESKDKNKMANEKAKYNKTFIW